MTRPRFNIGQTVISQGVKQAFEVGHMLDCLRRHVSGDWGDLDAHDKAVNETAVLAGGRILSKYGELWIITERDRSITTLLLPSEY